MQTKQSVIAAAGKLEMWESGCQVPAEPETSTSHTQPLDLVGTQPGTTSDASWQQRFSTEQLPNCGEAEFQEADSPATQHCGRTAFQHHRTTLQFNYCGGICGSALRTAPHSALLEEPVVQHRGQLHDQHCWMDLWFSTADSSAHSSVVQHRGQLRSQHC